MKLKDLKLENRISLPNIARQTKRMAVQDVHVAWVICLSCDSPSDVATTLNSTALKTTLEPPNGAGRIGATRTDPMLTNAPNEPSSASWPISQPRSVNVDRVRNEAGGSLGKITTKNVQHVGLPNEADGSLGKATTENAQQIGVRNEADGKRGNFPTETTQQIGVRNEADGNLGNIIATNVKHTGVRNEPTGDLGGMPSLSGSPRLERSQ